MAEDADAIDIALSGAGRPRPLCKARSGKWLIQISQRRHKAGLPAAVDVHLREGHKKGVVEDTCERLEPFMKPAMRWGTGLYSPLIHHCLPESYPC